MTSDAQKKRGYPLPNPITGNPLICFSMMIPDHPEYRSAVYGAITELGKWWNWEKTYEDGDTRASQTAQVMRELIHETLTIDTECFPDESGCLEYHNLSYIIEYFPNYPTDQTTPPGYLFPPWYIAPAINLIGAPEGAVVTDIARFPYTPGQPAEEFPRFRVHLNGTGTVELHLIAINFGGNAIIQVDGDLGQVEVFDLNQDIIAIPPETEDVIIIEREITTPGAHFIDVTMTPVLQNEIPPVLMGGGLLKVVLCGFDNMAREIEIRMIPAGEGCQQMQKKYTDESEEAWVDIGEPICNGQDGADGTTPECPDCDEPPNEDDGGVGVPPEPAPGSDAACQVARAVTDYVIAKYDAVLSSYLEEVVTNGMNLLEFSRIVQTIMFGVPSPLSALGNLFAWIAAQDALAVADNLASAQDADTIEKIFCHLYCALPENGDLTASVFAEWTAAITGDTAIVCRADLVAFMESIPLYELRTEAIAAVTFDIEADCAECDCDLCENRLATFDTGGQEYEIIVGTLSAGETGNGILADDVGNTWGGDYSWLAQVRFPLEETCAVKTVSVRYFTDIQTPPEATTGYSLIVETYLGGVLQADGIVSPVLATGEWHTVSFTYTTAVTADMVQVYLFNNTNIEGRTIEIRLDDVSIEFE